MRQGLARSRAEAAQLIRSGAVVMAGRGGLKPASEVPLGAEIVADQSARTPWVSRGATKLSYALTTWQLSPAGRRCLDVGASTGGFTQVLLTHGAATVVALDVGHGQLHPEVAADPRVINLEGRSIRTMLPRDLGGAFDVIVADLSFVSITVVARELAQLLRAPADQQSPWAVILVKPQFEVGRERLGKKGIVTDPAARRDALRRVVDRCNDVGLQACGVLKSPITGSHGNVEYLLWLVPGPSARMEPDGLEALMECSGSTSKEDW